MKAPLVHLFIQREDAPTLTITTDGLNGILATWSDSEWNMLDAQMIDSQTAAKLSHRLISSGIEMEALAFATLFDRLGVAV